MGGTSVNWIGHTVEVAAAVAEATEVVEPVADATATVFVRVAPVAVAGMEVFVRVAEATTVEVTEATEVEVEVEVAVTIAVRVGSIEVLVPVGTAVPQLVWVYVTTPVGAAPEPLQKYWLKAVLFFCTPEVALVLPWVTTPYTTSNLLRPSYSLTS